MESFENIPEKNKSSEISEDDVINIVLEMKKQSEENPDPINLHLKNIDEVILRNFLSGSENDRRAFAAAFLGDWHENSKDFKDYEEEALATKRYEKMDSGKSPLHNAKRDFAAMIRNYVISKDFKEKLQKRDNKVNNKDNDNTTNIQTSD